MSNQNVRLYFILLAIIFIIGPTGFIMNLGSEGTADFLTNMFKKTMFTGGINRDPWAAGWTLFFIPSIAAFAPLIGMFMARISYGRTVRELMIGYWIIPSVFNYVWFAIFGGTAINMQMTGSFDIWGRLQEFGLESAIFQFFQAFPGGNLLVYVFLLTIFVSFVTLADSMTSCIAIMSTNTAFSINKEDEEEPPALIKLVWGLTMGSTAYVFIAFSGISGAKMAAIMAGFPIYIICIGAIYSLYRVTFKVGSSPIVNIKSGDKLSS